MVANVLVTVVCITYNHEKYLRDAPARCQGNSFNRGTLMRKDSLGLPCFMERRNNLLIFTDGGYL